MKLTRKFTWKDSKKLVFFGIGAFLLLVLDFATKWIVELNLAEGELNAIIPNFLYFTKSYNTAIAFSLGSSLPMPVGRGINIAISVVMSVVIIWYWILHDPKFTNFQRVIAMLLAAGAVGNLIDRAFYWEATTGFNGVIDFIQFYLGGGPSKPQNSMGLNPFATFNLADSYLVIGVILLLILTIIDLIKEKRHENLSEDPRLAEAPKPIEKGEESNEETHC